MLLALIFLNFLLSIGVRGDQLVLVQSLFRHGDRTPTGTYPTDPYQEDFWPISWGQLTTVWINYPGNLYGLGEVFLDWNATTLRSRFENKRPICLRISVYVTRIQRFQCKLMRTSESTLSSDQIRQHLPPKFNLIGVNFGAS